MNHIIVNTIPHPYSDIFKYSIGKDFILIEKINSQLGWWFDLQIEVINSFDNSKQIINIGKNPSSKFKCMPIYTGKSPPTIYSPKYGDICISSKKEGKILYANTINSDDFNTTKDSIIIAVCSIIYVSNNKLDGNEKRSIFSPKQRFEQTLLTLKSIRKQVPEAIIVLLEKSISIPENEIQELSQYCDYLVRYNNIPDCNYYAHEQSINKGLGEMFVLSHFGDVIKNKPFKLFCKLGGRYVMNSKFSIADFDQPIPVFKCLPGEGRLGIIVVSVFYSIPNRFFKFYLEHTKLWLNKTQYANIEHILTMFVESLPEINLLLTLNIEGKGGTDGIYYNI
jgi:hypothetical protein